MPLVSVIIPSYSAEKYLKDAVASVLNQTYTDLELIIVDDASPDGTGALADQLATTDPRIRVIHHTENKRRSGALNTGVKAARGVYISFLDADDFYVPEKTEKQVAFLEEHPQVDMVYGDYQQLKADGVTLAPYKVSGALRGARQRLQAAAEGGQDSVFPKGDYIPGCSPLIRSRVFETVALDETLKNAEDLDLWLQIIGAGFTLDYLPLYTYTYRRHDEQKSSNKENMNQALAVIAEKIRTGAYLKEIPAVS